MAAWRHPDAYAESGTNFTHMVETIRTVERGLFDLFFLADGAALSLLGSR